MGGGQAKFLKLKKKKNPDKLFHTCKYGKCNFFKWGMPIEVSIEMAFKNLEILFCVATIEDQKKTC